MTRLLPLFAFGLAMAIVARPVLCHPTCSRVNAAFYYYGDMYFVIGNELVTMGEGYIKDMTSVSVLNFPHEITAAVSTPSGDAFYLISATAEQGYDDIGEPADMNILAYSDVEKAFSGEANFHGIDAAFEYAGELVYVSGCSYVFINPEDPTDVGHMMPNSDIGLPCDLDAALYATTMGGPVAIKGNKVWLLDPDTGIFDGPLDPKDVLFDFEGFNLCPIVSE